MQRGELWQRYMMIYNVDPVFSLQWLFFFWSSPEWKVGQWNVCHWTYNTRNNNVGKCIGHHANESASGYLGGFYEQIIIFLPTGAHSLLTSFHLVITKMTNAQCSGSICWWRPIQRCPKLRSRQREIDSLCRHITLKVDRRTRMEATDSGDNAITDTNCCTMAAQV